MEGGAVDEKAVLLLLLDGAQPVITDINRKVGIALILYPSSGSIAFTCSFRIRPRNSS